VASPHCISSSLGCLAQPGRAQQCVGPGGVISAERRVGLGPVAQAKIVAAALVERVQQRAKLDRWLLVASDEG